MILNTKDSFEVAMRDLLLAVLLTGFSFHVVGCQGPHGGDATRTREAITYYDRGVALHKRGELDGAIAEYRTALRLDPNDVNIHLNLGNALSAKGDLEEAIAEFRTALHLDPNHVNAHTNLGKALAMKGDLEGAIVEYRTTLRLNPNDVDAHYNLGIALQKLGRKAEAREEFTEVQRLLPDTPADQKKIELVRQRLRELE